MALEIGRLHPAGQRPLFVGGLKPLAPSGQRHSARKIFTSDVLSEKKNPQSLAG